MIDCGILNDVYKGKSKDLRLLLDRLTDDAKMLICDEIYADLTENRKCFRDFFSDYCQETETRGLYLRQAPWPENFSYGLGLIREWLQKKALKIENDTTLAHQLGKISEDLLEDPAEAEVDFYAVNALRYVLGGFQKYPWREPLKDIDFGDWSKYPGYYSWILF